MFHHHYQVSSALDLQLGSLLFIFLYRIYFVSKRWRRSRNMLLSHKSGSDHLSGGGGQEIRDELEDPFQVSWHQTWWELRVLTQVNTRPNDSFFHINLLLKLERHKPSYELTTNVYRSSCSQCWLCRSSEDCRWVWSLPEWISLWEKGHLLLGYPRTLPDWGSPHDR